MDGGDADGDDVGEVEGEVVEMDADERDIDLGSALANFASPLRCITVHARSPAEPCFGSIWYDLRRSNGRRRYPRLGFCFWETQDRCDDCKRPTCHLHGRKHNRPRSIARRFTPRMHGGGRYYDFACVHCKPNEHHMYTSGNYGARGVNAEAGPKHSPTSTPSLAGHGGTPRATFEHWHLMGS